MTRRVALAHSSSDAARLASPRLVTTRVAGCGNLAEPSFILLVGKTNYESLTDALITVVSSFYGRGLLPTQTCVVSHDLPDLHYISVCAKHNRQSIYNTHLPLEPCAAAFAFHILACGVH